MEVYKQNKIEEKKQQQKNVRNEMEMYLQKLHVHFLNMEES
jgi:hypothetical protein